MDMIDPRQALVAALVSGQIQAAQQPVQNKAEAIHGYHGMATALASRIANQRLPLGRARVTGNSPIDGGYNWARRGFVHPNPIQAYVPGTITQPGVNYGY